MVVLSAHSKDEPTQPIEPVACRSASRHPFWQASDLSRSLAKAEDHTAVLSDIFAVTRAAHQSLKLSSSTIKNLASVSASAFFKAEKIASTSCVENL